MLLVKGLTGWQAPRTMTAAGIGRWTMVIVLPEVHRIQLALSQWALPRPTYTLKMLNIMGLCFVGSGRIPFD